MEEAGADRGPAPVRALQERAARALPAAHVEDLRGWWLRLAPGCAWWVGTVLPHGDAPPGELPARIAEAEAFYAHRGTGTVFQVTPGACPERLDAALEERGYRRRTPMSLQAAPVAKALLTPGASQPATGAVRPALGDVRPESTAVRPARGGAPAGQPAVRVAESPGEAWWAVWKAGVHHGEGAERRSEEALLARVQSPSAFACASLGGEPVAIGRAVVDAGWAGVFDVVTLPHARGKGAARAVQAALAAWAGSRGAGGLYLQVERDNVPALRLYAWAGFREVAEYHYRARP